MTDIIKLLDLEGKMITFDASIFREKFATELQLKILKVQDNQKDLKDDIKTYFNLGHERDDTAIMI